jgi:hypothetical protein
VDGWRPIIEKRGFAGNSSASKSMVQRGGRDREAAPAPYPTIIRVRDPYNFMGGNSRIINIIVGRVEVVDCSFFAS